MIMTGMIQSIMAICGFWLAVPAIMIFCWMKVVAPAISGSR
ncbi:Uncharacterised protein [Mycobacteroides abscessus subsp. abscessus]|nr:Uncharacterised protein [Mycobacteroides abscessus subsp. abscessus]